MFGAAGLGLLIPLVLGGMLFLGQSFTGRVSLAVQQSSSPPLLLAGLGIGGGANRKYVGVLKSAWMAGEVERKVSLKTLYSLPNDEDAIEMLTKRVVVDDNPADGLLYISVTLPGPPILAADGKERRDKVRRAAQTAANAYAELLKSYVVNLDNDRELVLLRAARQQLNQARANYNRAVEELAGFVKRSPVGSEQQALADAEPKGGASDSRPISAAAGLLQQLYTQKGTAEVELRSLEAVSGKRENLVGRQIDAASSLPAEDPLLAESRNNVLAARRDLQALNVQYGPDHPAVVTARQKLAKLEDRVKVEGAAIRSGLTSDRVQAAVRRSDLQTRLTTLSRQITAAERKYQAGREVTTDFDAMRGEVALRLEVLKQTASQAAVLGIQTVSAQSRIAVVDRARLPRKGTPGTLLIGAGSLLIVILALGVWTGAIYVKETAASAIIAAPARETKGVAVK